MKKNLVVFLDFDGVLHHFFPVKEASDDENAVFYYVPVFNDFIKKIKEHFEVSIVFATSWKEKFSFEDMKDFFEFYPETRDVMIGATPNLKMEKDKGHKWREAQAWMLDNQYDGEYIIFDDYDVTWDNQEEDEFSFMYTRPQYYNERLIVCNNKFGKEEIEKASKLLDIKI